MALTIQRKFYSADCLRRIVGASIVLVSMVVVSGCRKAADTAAAEKSAPEAVVVETAMASIRPMEVVVQAQGTLSPGQGAIARLSSPAPGRLVAVNVKEGDHVNAGQILASVDNRPQQALARSAAAAVTSADAVA